MEHNSRMKEITGNLKQDVKDLLGESASLFTGFFKRGACTVRAVADKWKAFAHDISAAVDDLMKPPFAEGGPEAPMVSLDPEGEPNIQKDGTGKEIWMPVARNGLQNKEPIEILAQFNGEIRGIYNYYRLARNVSVLNKFCYVMEYSMYKTIARKMRCSAAKVKKKYTRDRIFGIEYETKHGIKRAEFYHNGFRKSAPSKLDMDTTPDYRYSIRPKEVIARFMTGYCELCCKNELPVMIYQVKNLKSLSGNEPWEQFMLKKRRKTLIVCEDCYKTITNS